MALPILKARRRKRTKIVSQRRQNDNNVTFARITVVVVLINHLPSSGFLWHGVVELHIEKAMSCGGYYFYLRYTTNTLVVLTSPVNFVLYVLFNKRFRHVLVQTVGCCSVMVDGRRPKSTGRPARVKDVSCMLVKVMTMTGMSKRRSRLLSRMIAFKVFLKV